MIVSVGVLLLGIPGSRMSFYLINEPGQQRKRGADGSDKQHMGLPAGETSYLITFAFERT